MYYWRTFILTKCVIYCCTYIIYSIYISLSIFTSMYVLAHVNLLKILLFKWTIDSVACSFNLFFILVHKQMQIENMKICICNNNIIPPNIVTVPINLLQILSLPLSTYCKYCHCSRQLIANIVTVPVNLLQIVSLPSSNYCK